jgi:hypothetical protein
MSNVLQRREVIRFGSRTSLRIDSRWICVFVPRRRSGAHAARWLVDCIAHGSLSGAGCKEPDHRTSGFFKRARRAQRTWFEFCKRGLSRSIGTVRLSAKHEPQRRLLTQRTEGEFLSRLQRRRCQSTTERNDRTCDARDRGHYRSVLQPGATALIVGLPESNAI